MTPFIGQIMAVAFNFAPKGWVLCNGQLLPINQNQALFSLLGTTYGGDGVRTFGLPNLQARLPVGSSNNFALGSVGGEMNVTLNSTQVPQHNHNVIAATSASSNNPAGNILGTAPLYQGASASSVTMSANAISPAGGSQPHSNQQPYIVVNYCIALVGIFPSRN